ncbi:MAG TPA: DUF1697 domain-containing protein [Pyrinomonadaceae bacterium]|nr:DUF1697 domain-containing protein [Pyrinomonadaceae bacterium]
MEQKTYIAFLRGINIGGQRVRMEELRALFSALGFGGVRSYIQTGNIFFETDDAEDRAALTRKIEEHLAAALGYEVPTFLRTIPEVERMLQLDPFKHLTATPDTRFLITFISRPLAPAFKLPHVSPKQDYEILHATRGEVFSLLRIIGGRPSNPAPFIEKSCGAKTTSRFFATTARILQAAKSV